LQSQDRAVSKVTQNTHNLLEISSLVKVTRWRFRPLFTARRYAWRGPDMATVRLSIILRLYYLSLRVFHRLMALLTVFRRVFTDRNH